MRAGRGLRVVLHREGGQVERLEALDHVVVEVDVADHDAAVATVAVRCHGLAVQRRVDREPVVVRRDLDLAGGPVHHRLVHAAVAVAELVGAVARARGPAAGCRSRCRRTGSCGPARRAGARSRASRPTGRRGRWRRRRRPARWPARPRWSRSTGSTWTRTPRSASRCGVMALMPRSTAATVATCSPDGLDDVGRVGGHLAGQVGTDHGGRGQHVGQQLVVRPALPVGVEQGGAGEDPGPHDAALAQVTGQRAGVDVADADDRPARPGRRPACAPSASWTGAGRGRARRSPRPRSGWTRRPRR